MKKKRPRYLNADISRLIDDYIHSERDRALLKRKLIDNISYEQLAEEFKLSVTWTKEIVYKNEVELFSNLPVK